MVQVSCGNGMPTAAVRLIGPGNAVLADASLGTGPVDAVYKAINRNCVRSQQFNRVYRQFGDRRDRRSRRSFNQDRADGVSYTGRGLIPILLWRLPRPI